METQDYIVEMKQISKFFPGVVANHDISLGIRKGEVFALLGENGAGKSTLMSMLFGMYEPDEGEIWVRGKKVKITSPNEAVKLDIGMVHQHFKLVENFTVTENIVMGIEPIKKLGGFLPMVDIKGTNKKILDLSQQYGLEVEPSSKTEDLKVYARQRVEILKMLYRKAEILIFDEPTAVLTPQEIAFLLDIIRKLRAAGKTVILISHKLQEIKQVADRCAVLNRGKLVDIMDVSASSVKEMARAMVGRDVVLDINKAAPSYGETVLEVENLTVLDHNNFPLVKDVSFMIRSGEIFAIAGVSGNGQVELADAISGMSDSKSGRVILNGRDITQQSVRERSLAGISYIPEDRQMMGLILDFSLADNLTMKKYFDEPFCHKGMLEHDHFNSYAEQLIGKYDIRSGGGAKGSARAMSGGNQQKAIVAREIEQQNPLMIFVQPTRGMDIGAVQSIRERMLEERGKGRAILLISLDLDEIIACADTIGVMYSGEMLKIAPADSISTDEVGEYMMGVKQYG